MLALLACANLFALALADVYATGDVNLRTGPGLAYDAVASVDAGARLTFLDDIQTDDQGRVTELDWSTYTG